MSWNRSQGFCPSVKVWNVTFSQFITAYYTFVTLTIKIDDEKRFKYPYALESGQMQLNEVTHDMSYYLD